MLIWRLLDWRLLDWRPLAWRLATWRFPAVRGEWEGVIRGARGVLCFVLHTVAGKEGSDPETFLKPRQGWVLRG